MSLCWRLTISAKSTTADLYAFMRARVPTQRLRRSRLFASFSGDAELLEIDSHGQVIGLEKTNRFPPRSDSANVLAGMGVYVFKASALHKALFAMRERSVAITTSGKMFFPI